LNIIVDPIEKVLGRTDTGSPNWIEYHRWKTCNILELTKFATPFGYRLFT